MKLRLFSLAVLLFAGNMVTAQLRMPDAPNAGIPVFANNDAGRGLLGNLLSKTNLKINHSYEMSVGSFGAGQSGALGLWTTNFNMQFNPKLDANVAVGLAHTPFGGGGLGLNKGQNAKLFIENVELNYRPKENTNLRLSFRQLPYQMPYGYGGYGNPYQRW